MLIAILTKREKKATMAELIEREGKELEVGDDKWGPPIKETERGGGRRPGLFVGLGQRGTPCPRRRARMRAG